MSTRVIIGAADAALATELRAMISEVDDTQIVQVTETTTELSAVVGRERPDIVFVHDRLGPVSTNDIVRDLAFRAPATAILVVNTVGDIDGAISAMEAGARGALSHPLSFDALLDKFEGARQWAARMGGLIQGAADDSTRGAGRHGHVTVFTGAKGGVGTTTIATHLAIDIQRKAPIPGIRVCLVDLDLAAGDVSGILEARQRVSIADVAKVSQDLDASTIMDAVVMHESGVALLLAPLVVQETEHVTPESVRAMLGLLRQQFHVVIVDGGTHPTPAQAAAVEVADEVVTLVTADVLAMRSFRRLVQAWESLGVRTEQEIQVLLNRVSREDVVNHDAVSRLTSARMLQTQVPSAFRRLERGVNSRNPEDIRDAGWWRTIERIGAEVGVLGGQAPRTAAATRTETASKPGKRRGRSRSKAEAGQLAIETVALVPIVVLICLLTWQLGLTALSFVWNGHAANAAARAQAIGEDPLQAARDAVPDSVRNDVHVVVLSDGSVRVTTDIPVLCPGCGRISEITTTKEAVDEP